MKDVINSGMPLYGRARLSLFSRVTYLFFIATNRLCTAGQCAILHQRMLSVLHVTLDEKTDLPL